MEQLKNYRETALSNTLIG